MSNDPPDLETPRQVALAMDLQYRALGIKEQTEARNQTIFAAREAGMSLRQIGRFAKLSAAGVKGIIDRETT